MYNILRGFDAQTVSNCINPYAVDVIRAKRRDLIYGISNTEDLLDLLVAEGVMTAAKRSIILTIRTRTDQNSRVLDVLEARGEQACRKFFHPCLMRVQPDLYLRVRAYVEQVNEQIKDTRRQLIGYLLEKEKEGQAGRVVKTDPSSLAVEESGRSCAESADRRLVKAKAALAADGELVLLEELLEDTHINTGTSSNETLLHVAAKHGRLSIAELLIRKGARTDLQDHDGHTALHRAASRGHTEVVQALVKAGASIYTVDHNNKTPVHLAAENGRRDSVQVLVREEADQHRNRAQDTFLHMAAAEDDWKLAEMLLQSGAAVDAKNHHEETALFHAVSRNKEKTVRVLLNAGATVGSDVIDEAVRLNHMETLRLLLANARTSVSVEVLNAALFSAVRLNRDEAVAALTDGGADANAIDPRGYSPLLLSAQLGHAHCFRVLLEKQAKVDVTLPDLSSALHLAVSSSSGAIVQTLLDRGLDPDVTGPKAQTPLHVAARGNHAQLTALLVKAGAQVDAAAQDGLTALHLASQQNHAETVTQLLQNQADAGVRDRLGRTALHWAASCPEDSRVLDILLSSTSDPSATDHERKTALHLAAAAGNLTAVTSLLTHKAKGGVKDMDGSTPLHHAAAGGHRRVVSALLKHLDRKGMEERNAWRKTPLHAAAERGHDGVVVLLLEAGAAVNATDHSRDTPLHCAARGGHQEAVRRLASWGQASHGGRKKANLKATNNVGKTALQVAQSGDTAEHQRVTTFLKRKMFLIKEKQKRKK